MPRIGVSITKQTAFRNSTQEFSNVYYYEDAIGGLPSNAAATAIIDELTAFEKTVHSSLVTFTRGRLWSTGGGAAANDMIAQKALTGTGSTSAVAGLDKERAFLFRIRAGSDGRGNPVYLRKWYHSCGSFGGVSGISQTILENTTGFAQATRDTYVTAMQTIGAVGGGTEPWKICSKGGRFPTAGAGWSAHQFLEHHQLGDQWRNF